MEQQNPAPPLAPRPPVPAQVSAQAFADRAHWTPARQRVFLTALVQTGNVARAARVAGMSRSSAHRLRRRLAGTPFDRSWDRALALHAQRLADPFAADPFAADARPSAPGRR